MFGCWYCRGKDAQRTLELLNSIDAKLNELLKRAPVTSEDMKELRDRLGTASNKIKGEQHG